MGWLFLGKPETSAEVIEKFSSDDPLTFPSNPAVCLSSRYGAGPLTFLRNSVQLTGYGVTRFAGPIREGIAVSIRYCG